MQSDWFDFNILIKCKIVRVFVQQPKGQRPGG